MCFSPSGTNSPPGYVLTVSAKARKNKEKHVMYLETLAETHLVPLAKASHMAMPNISGEGYRLHLKRNQSSIIQHITVRPLSQHPSMNTSLQSTDQGSDFTFICVTI